MAPIKVKVKTSVGLDGRMDQGERGATLERSQAAEFTKIIFDPSGRGCHQLGG